MDLPFQSIASTTPSAHGRSQSKPRVNKTSISQRISTLKGIIRIPTRRASTRDEDITTTSHPSFPPGHGASAHYQHQHLQQQHQPLHQRSRSTTTDSSLGTPIIDTNTHSHSYSHRGWVKSKNNNNHPYGFHSSSSSTQGDKDGGLMKPYMSQPMLGTELSRGTGGIGGRERGRNSLDDDDDEYDDELDQQHQHRHNAFGYESEEGQSQSPSGSGSGSGEGSGSGFGILEREGGVAVLSTPAPASGISAHPPPPPPASSKPANSLKSAAEASRPTMPGRPFSTFTSSAPTTTPPPSSSIPMSMAASTTLSPSSSNGSTKQIQVQENQHHGKKFSISNALFGGSGAHAGLSFAPSPSSRQRPKTSDGLGSGSRQSTERASLPSKDMGVGTGAGAGTRHRRAPSRDLPPLPPPSPLDATVPFDNGNIRDDETERYPGSESASSAVLLQEARSSITATPVAYPPLPQQTGITSASATSTSVAIGGNDKTTMADSRLDSNSIDRSIPTTTPTAVPISIIASPSLPPRPSLPLVDSVTSSTSHSASPFHESHVSSYPPSSAFASAHTLAMHPDFNPSLPAPISALTTSDGPTVLSSYGLSAPSSSSSSSLLLLTAHSDLPNLPGRASAVADFADVGPSAADTTIAIPPTISRSTSTGPKLKRPPPPNHRFSLTFSSSTSSSMPGGMPILPLPAVPIYGVGVGVGGGGAGAGGGGEKPNGNGDSRAKRLSGMPALHLQGTGRGTRAHEELDEEEEEDEEEEGEEEEEEMDGDGELSRSSISSEMSMSSSTDDYSNSVSSSSDALATLGSRTTITSSARNHEEEEEDGDFLVDYDHHDEDGAGSIASRTSSYKTALMDPPSAPASTSPSPLPSPGPSYVERHSYFGDMTRPPEKRFSRAPLLPPVETGKLELDFSFLEKPPPDDVLGGKSRGISNKGKGRAGNRHTVDVDRRTEDAGRTPIVRRGSTPWGTGTNSSSRHGQAATDAAPARAQVDGFAPNSPPQRPNFGEGRGFSDSTIQGVHHPGNVSPARTPRAEDYFQSINVMTPTMGSSRVYDSGLPVNTMPPMPQRSSEARLSSRLSITQHPGIYKHASRSLIDVHAVEKKEKVEQMVREDEEAEEEDRKRRVKALRLSMKGAAVRGSLHEEVNDHLGGGVTSGAKFPSKAGIDGALVNDTDNIRDPGRTSLYDAAIAGGLDAFSDAESCSASGVIGSTEGRNGSAATGAGLNKRISMAPPYDALSHPLRRRRSMPTFNAATAPPPYPDFAPHPAFGLKNIQIMPREDEGKEKLPPYTNDIKLMAIMPRKLEFTRPGVQAKDRKWRRVLCVLEGTVFKVYKAPSGASGVSAIGEWWESKVGVGDVAQQAPLTTTSFQTSSVAANGSSRRLSGTNPGDFIRGTGEEGVRAAIAAVEQAEREEEDRRERDLVRARKNGEVEVGILSPVVNSPGADSPVQVQTPPVVLQVQVPGHRQFPVDQASYEGHPASGGLIPATRSALNLAVQLLKPGGSSRHGRSSSDVCLSPTRPRSPRSSLNIPRSGRTTPTSSLRSRSPTPSPSLISHSRPSTPATSISVNSTSHSHSQLQSQSHTASSSRSGFRVGPGSMANSNTRTSNARPGPRVNVSLTPREKEKAKEKAIEPQKSDLIKVYTMQNAESGLGSDYVKRKHVIRVRLEGEQFLLQAQDVDSVIAWIEGLQSATNIALDLDQRPMPRGPIFPRRRRRRRAQPPSVNTNVTNEPPANPSPTGQTPVTARHLAAPLTRSGR